MDVQREPTPPKRPGMPTNAVLLLALGVAVIVGAAAGAAGGAVVSGVFDRLPFLGGTSAVDGRDVEPEIVRMIEEESATIRVVEKVTPSVVSIVVKKGSSARAASAGSYGLPAEPGAGLVEVGGGTGLIVSADGMIVTNRHVVDDGEAVYTVVLSDGQEMDARVLAKDSFLDIALLDIDGEGYPAATLGDSDALRIGQTVIAVGNTLSEYRNTVTKGVVSGINRRVVAGAPGGEEVIDHAIQTDAAINPGNSGGPLIDLFGEVIGINTAVSYQGESIGFAIPSGDVARILSDVQEFGRIVRPWMGVRFVMLDAQAAKDNGLDRDVGAYVVGDGTPDSAVFPGSPADLAGIKAGDVIVMVDGTPVDQDHTLSDAIADLRPGDQIRVRMFRGDTPVEVAVTLDELDPDLFR